MRRISHRDGGVTAKEIAAKIKLLYYRDPAFGAPLTKASNLWEQKLASGAVLHVRCEPERYFGVYYRIWVTKRLSTKILQMLFAMKPETAGKKARSIVTKYGAA